MATTLQKPSRVLHAQELSLFALAFCASVIGALISAGPALAGFGFTERREWDR